ncbi:DUF1674-domain-containing protein [Trichodelitschia bisporula]|uniref:Succinate dehydrogenase assembly factor 4, mitochondrial n=1 Tax=Trichodelitschia bisporula TaxID=703511 RepID=A0A6G1IAF2_9PEZI|nr:DUF1674-domain-containing protein [Trichodelitschia bisporula]
MPPSLPRPLSRLLPQLTRSRLQTRASSFNSGPAPPPLPKEEQELFEKLQRQSTGAFSTPRPESEGVKVETTAEVKIEAQELHPDVRRGAPPEFEGDRNPKTGEVGGPKNEPLRWGAKGDWSFNGRVTDF